MHADFILANLVLNWLAIQTLNVRLQKKFHRLSTMPSSDAAASHLAAPYLSRVPIFTSSVVLYSAQLP